MKIPQKLDYALRVMVHLAKRYENTKNFGALTQLDDLAEIESISIHFLAQIMNELRRSHIVESRRGKHGGYVLGRDPSTITVLDLILALEGNMLSIEQTTTGPAASTAGHAWERLNEAVETEAAKITLADLAVGDQLPMFYI